MLFVSNVLCLFDVRNRFSVYTGEAMVKLHLHIDGIVTFVAATVLYRYLGFS